MNDMLNGSGLRTVLWVAGCDRKCYKCQNPQTWDECSGIPFTEKEITELANNLSKDYISGITFSGGDPLYINNRETITRLAKWVKSGFPNKTIWLYTGHLWEEVKDLEVIQYLDVLVDGRFIYAERDVTYPWCGSRNQRVIDVPKTLSSGSIVLYQS
jgi:anaerobic ribonucleoside-triphosphate reductase activating protein